MNQGWQRSHWWTERCLRSPLFLSLSLSFSLCFSIFLWLSTYLTYWSICLSIYLSVYLSRIYLAVYFSSYLSIYLSIDLSIYLSICLSVYLSICLLSIYLSVYLSTCLFVVQCHSVQCSVDDQVCPDLLTSLMNMSFVLRLPRKCISADLLQMSHACHHIILGNATKPSRFGHFWQGAQSLASATRNGIWTSKNGPYMVCFVHFDFEMCFAPQGRAFFDIATSKSGPYMVCFVHFDFEMCFAPQRRAFFRHRNFQKWSDNAVFCAFWLGNVLRATTACIFSTSQTSKSGPTMLCFVHFDLEMCFAPQRHAFFRHRNFQKCSERGVFCTFWLRNVLRAATACNFSSLIWPAGSAPAALASLLFDPPEPQIIGKNTVFRDFPTFSRICIFFLLTLSLLRFSLIIFLFSLTLSISAFHLSILSEVWLLNFLRLSGCMWLIYC